MNPFLLRLLSICGIMLVGNGFPYIPLSGNENRDDDYYEDYLRKIPKLKTSPHKVKEFLLNHLSWFPVEELEADQGDAAEGEVRKPKYFVNVFLEDDETTSTTNSPNIYCDLSLRVKNKLKQLKNFSDRHSIRRNWSALKSQTRKRLHKVRKYIQKKRFKETFINLTHPLRYRGSRKNCSPDCSSCYRFEGPSIRLHPKSSHVEVIKTSTTTEFIPWEMHFSAPRKFKVIIDLNTSEKPLKQERNVNVHDKYLTGAETDGNTTTVLETAGEMASDLAGRVTRVWHCVLGTRRLPDIRDVKFYLYTRRNIIQPELLKVNYDLIGRKIKANPQYKDVDCVDLPPENISQFERVSDENRRIIRSNFLNIRAPTKILIHGYTGSYKDSRMAKIKDAYLTNGRYNVIQVDWEMLAAPPCYIRVTQHSKFVGETIAKFLDGLYLIGLNMSLVHLVGFSLGAQVAGFVGNNATITPVCRITGLDPALPLFLHTQPSGHLDRLDAKFVDVIHTCGGILAMLDPLGHVDFYPNGGTRQPGCEFSNLKCSHSRAPQYFAESVTSHKKFRAQLCPNWEEYVTGNCGNNTDISYMGEPCSRRSVSGKYYLLTKSKEPFVL